MNNINDSFGEWQRAAPPIPPNPTSQTLNQIIENNRNNINNYIIYSKLEKLENDIEQIKAILLKLTQPQPINYQFQPTSLFNGINPPFINNNIPNNLPFNVGQTRLF